MKFLKTGLSVALAVTGLSLVPGTPSVAVGAPRAADDPSALSQMRATADGQVRVSTEKATGKVGFISARGADADLLPGVEADDRASAAAKATAYLERFGSAFGLTRGQVEQTDVVQDRYGWVVTFQQQYRGIPVFAGTLKATLDEAGDLGAVSGFAAPDLAVSTTPAVSAAKAGARAVSIVRAEPPTTEGGADADTTGIKAVSTELVVYRTGAIRGVAGESVLAYVVEVSNAENIRDVVVVDANANKLVNRWSTVNDALDRELKEATGTKEDPVLTTVWSEGDPFPGDLNQDQRNLIESAGESYWMFANSFGRDSYDGDGAKQVTVNNDPRIDCPNANWNGTTTNYCDGVTSDDIVSHEWGHAYTEYTSGLIYQYQPGALNESYSDVWGETLDLINGREDEDEQFTAKRTDGDCGAAAPPGIDFVITAPANVAGPCFAVAASGAKEFTAPVTAQVVVATDAVDATSTSTTDGCTAFTNAAAVNGKWAYVDRGTCTFAVKVANAKTAGATGIVIGNNNTDIPAGFSGDPDLYGVMVGQADGTRIKSAGEVTATVTAEDTSTRVETTRWAIGEKSEAFGGAIRDMWNPTCYGDPGKVSDAEYKCDPLLSDAGGVHSNSGVPNKAYALVVDGGTANGQTVTGLGIDKAAAIWWRAQSAYLTPASNFADAADAWETSCTDLVGQDINVVTTEPDAEEQLATPIAAGDCASVTAAIAATEMRSGTPERCNFRPILTKGAPGVCGTGFKTKTVWNEKFEDGLAGWEKDQEIADLGGYQGGFGAPWRLSENAPLGREGGVAYGPAPDRGDCSGDGVNDFSSRDTIISPVISMPGKLPNAKFSFDHYVATEAGFDGGNLKISVNEGRFTVVDPSQYVFNKPNTTMTTVGGGNTSPLEGQAGFSGTDGGEVRGSWGTSIVDLAKVGVKPGDKVRFRFDIGRDGCGGIDGWYLDNLKVTTCDKSKTAPSKTVATAPATRKVGQDFQVKVSVSKKGKPATGDVVLRSEGELLGTATLSKGKATIKVTDKVGPGTITLKAAYLGNATTSASKDYLQVRITR